MNCDVEALSKELSLLAPEEAAKRLVEVDETLAIAVGCTVPNGRLKQILVEVYRKLVDTRLSLELRSRALLLLRDLSSEVNSEVVRALSKVATSSGEDESLRCLLLDAIEKLWFGKDISTYDLEKVLENVDCLPNSELANRCFRILVGVGTTRAIEHLRRCYAASFREQVLTALSESSTDWARGFLDELLKNAYSQEESESIARAICLNHLVRVKRTIFSSSTERLNASDIDVLVANHEFALLHSAMSSGRLNARDIRGIGLIDPIHIKSKSQRRFFRILNERATRE
jgi:hypothetical protein